MNPSYAEWIAAYVARQPEGFVRGKCKEAAKEMAAAFPELRVAAGFVYCTWGRDEHFWCVTSDGELVDPTESQFQAVFNYEELDLNDPKTRDIVPIGKCMNCGEETYVGSLGSDICSQSCHDSFVAYLNSAEGRY